MGLFSKIPYHFPAMRQLGEWEWDSKHNEWTLNLHPGSRTLVQLRLTQHFILFNDERVSYSHVIGQSMDLEDLSAAFIIVTGEDGREYLWRKISEHWRNDMNKGKRTEAPCDFPFPINQLPMRSESSKDFWEYRR